MKDSDDKIRIAVVIGSTGLIGSTLLEELANTKDYQQIHIVGRSLPEKLTDKMLFHQADLLHLSPHQLLFKEADVFCCLGTTMKKAGSKEKFKEVDHDMILSVGKMAEEVSNRFILISSLGANPASSNFYLKTKGETEKGILKLNIPTIIILRPSILFGPRKENRLGEKIGILAMKLFAPLLIGNLRKYRGNDAIDVARTMIKKALTVQPGKYIIEANDITLIGRDKKFPSSNPTPKI